MINDGPFDPAAQAPVSAALFDALAFPADAYCEAFSSPAKPREHWQTLIAALKAMAPEGLGQRQDRVRRMRHEDGAAYNPFDAPTERGIPWALDMIPMPLTAGEWAGLSAGLIQRARLLERILADAYGPQGPAQGRRDRPGADLCQSEFSAPLPRPRAGRRPVFDLLRRRPVSG